MGGWLGRCVGVSVCMCFCEGVRACVRACRRNSGWVQFDRQSPGILKQ